MKGVNNLLESNHRCHSPLRAGEKFGSSVHAQGCALGAGRPANR